MVFLVNAATYAIVTPLAGWIGDKTVRILAEFWHAAVFTGWQTGAKQKLHKL